VLDTEHQRTLDRGKQNVEVRLPKYGSERSVPMPDELAAILRRHH